MKTADKAHERTGLPVEAFLAFVASAKQAAKTGGREKGGWFAHLLS
jgi:hypothetical protein